MIGKRYILCIIYTACAFMCVTCDTAGNLDPVYKDYFVKYYGGVGDQEGVDLIVDETDQSLLLLGNTISGQASRIYLVKTDWQGNIHWKRTLGGTSEKAKDIEVTNDGGYVILTEVQGAEDDVDIKLLKISAEGVAVDSMTYGYPPIDDVYYPNEYPVTVSVFEDSYIITGSTDRNTNWADLGATTISDILVIQLDANLDTLYTDVYSNGGMDYGVKTVQTETKRRYVLGSSNRTNNAGNGLNENYNFLYLELDELATGEGGTFGDDNIGNDEVLKAVCPGLVPGFFFVGTYTTTGGSGVNDIYIGRTIGEDLLYNVNNGNQIIITKDEGGRRKIEPVAVCPSLLRDGVEGYLILGNEGESNARNIWVTKVDYSGGVLWSASFGAAGGNDDTAGAIAELSDGSVVIIGTVNLGDENILKMALFKLNSEGKFGQ